MKKSIAWCAALVLVLSLAACGGDDGDSGAVSAEAFAKEICTASAEWQNTLQTSLADFQEAATQQSDPVQIKAGVSDAFTKFRDATDDLIGRIDGAGTPADEGAQEFKDRFTTTLGSIKSSLDDLIGNLEGIATDSANKFKKDLQAIAAGFQESLGALGDPFQGMPEELKTKFQEEEACTSLVGAG
jgi:soluble cytochrome b562